MKTLTLAFFAMLTCCAFALPPLTDDGNENTIRARFEWEQEPADPVVTGYRVYVWKASEPTTSARIYDVPSAPQVGLSLVSQQLLDGFERGEAYKLYVTATANGGTEESLPSPILEFRVKSFIQPPKLPKVEVQASLDLDTTPFLPLSERSFSPSSAPTSE